MCGSEEVRVSSTEVEILADKGNRLETPLIVFPPLPCGSDCTVKEAVVSSYAPITRYKLIY